MDPQSTVSFKKGGVSSASNYRRLQEFLSVEFPRISGCFKSLFNVSVALIWMTVLTTCIASYIVYADSMTSVWDTFSGFRLIFGVTLVPVFITLFIIGVEASYRVARFPDFLGARELAVIVAGSHTVIFLVNLTTIYSLVMSEEVGAVKVLSVAATGSLIAIAVGQVSLLFSCQRMCLALFLQTTQEAVLQSFKMTGLFLSSLVILTANIYLCSKTFIYPISATLIGIGLVYVGFHLTRSMMRLSNELESILKDAVNLRDTQSNTGKG